MRSDRMRIDPAAGGALDTIRSLGSRRPLETGRSSGRLSRSERTGLGRWAASMVFVAAIVAAWGCGPDAGNRIAARILEDYGRNAAARPLSSAGLVRVRLRPEGENLGGTLDVEWETSLFRETISSAGLTLVRGIQGGKAFETDEDGVTRVGSEPMLAELVTRSYFWRRAYLFGDRDRARLALGPADEKTVSVRLRPRGGNDLLLVFDRNVRALLAVRSPRFRLDFSGPKTFHDASRGDRSFSGEIVWSGLPTRRLPDAVVGGWRGRFSGGHAEAPLDAGSRIRIPARVSGVSASLEIDANEDGPLRVSPDLAAKAKIATKSDTFGRLVGGGVTLDIDALTMPSLHAVVGPTPAGTDAVAGGPLFRESVVEIDPSSRILRLHDPEKWAPPDGFGRIVLDDDGNRPVATLLRSGRRLRLRAGVPSETALVLAAPIAKELGIAGSTGRVAGIVWGSLRLPPLPVGADADAGFDPDWGDDGAVGDTLLLELHVFLDMPHRWIYIRPIETPRAQGQSDR